MSEPRLKPKKPTNFVEEYPVVKEKPLQFIGQKLIHKLNFVEENPIIKPQVKPEVEREQDISLNNSSKEEYLKSLREKVNQKPFVNRQSFQDYSLPERVNLEEYKNKEDIVTLQTKLKNLKLYQDEPDGIIGPKTINAVNQHNLSKTRHINVDTLKSRSDIENIQRLLKSKGYDLGNYGKNKDGIDGILGSKTKQAINDFNSKSGGVTFWYDDKGKGTPCIEDQCASYVQGELFRRSNLKNIDHTKFLTSIGLQGNAWNISKNIINKGGKIIYDSKSKSNVSTPQVGDIVSIFTGGRSIYQTRADIEGDGNSHVGFISRVYPDGSYDVDHNVHTLNALGQHVGNAKTDKFVNHQKGSFVVRKITRPNYNSLTGKGDLYSDEIDPNARVFYDNSNNNAQSALNILNTNRQKLASQFRLSEEELASLTQASLGIINTESKFGESFDKIPFLDPDLVRKVKENLTWLYKVSTDPLGYVSRKTEESRGLGRVKRNMNFPLPNQYKTEVLNYNPQNVGEQSAIETFIILAKNYNKFKLQGKDSKEALYRAIAAHNSPGKASGNFADDLDLDYVNKTFLNSHDSGLITSKGDTLNTNFNNMLLNEKVLENLSKIPSVQQNLSIENLPEMKPKLKPKKLQQGDKIYQLGIGSDPNSVMMSMSSNSDKDKLFAPETKPVKSEGYKMPYVKPTSHEVDAVLNFVLDKYKLKEKFAKSNPHLADKLNKKFANYEEWRSTSDQIAKENPSSYFKVEDVITDPKDRYLFTQAMQDRLSLLGTGESDVKGTGANKFDIGFRTLTQPLTAQSHYIHIDSKGNKSKVTKKWTFTGSEFKAIPDSLPID